MSQSVVLEVFSDYVCPWCYLASARVARLKQEHGVKVELVHFPLHPETPPEGKSLQELFAGRGYDIPKLQAQMRARMQAEGLPYGDRKMTYNSRLAQELGKWTGRQSGRLEVAGRRRRATPLRCTAGSSPGRGNERPAGRRGDPRRALSRLLRRGPEHRRRRRARANRRKRRSAGS